MRECKLWKGDQQITEAVNQLLGYLTWRDCKTALVVFNKDVAGFAQLQEKMPKFLKAIQTSFEVQGHSYPDEWQKVFRSSDDPDRMVTIHVFLFNLFVSR